MKRTILYIQRQNQSNQLELQSNPPQQMVHQPRHSLRRLHLRQRDLHILSAIQDSGGVLTTVQIAHRFWPLDLRRRLTGWAGKSQRIQTWLDQYSPAFLDEKIEMLRWGQKLNCLRQSQRVRKGDQKLVAWLHGLDARVAQELWQWLDSLTTVAQEMRLTQVIEQNGQPPIAFRQRPRFPSDSVSSACKTRLKYLVDAGFLEPYEQALRLSEGRAQISYFLTRKGFNLVAEAKRVKPKELDFKSAGAYGTLHLTHRLLINNFRLALQLQCERKKYDIRRWLDDNQLRRMLAKEKITLTRLLHNPQTGERRAVEEQHSLKISDGYFWLDMGAAGERHCFLEIDNQTLTLESGANTKDFASKIRMLAAFYKGRYKEIFPEAGESMWLLTVTTGSEERLKHLKATAEGVIGKQNRAVDRYWFTTAERIPTWEDYFSTAVFSPIWLRGGTDSNRLWSLDETV